MLLLFSGPVSLMIFGAALLLALAIDRYLGEPAARLHPVVWMGNYLNWAAKRLRPAASPDIRDLNSFWLAVFYWCAGAALVLGAACAVQWVAFQLPLVLAMLLLGVALKPMLAWAMLRSEVQAVEAALGESLDAGRRRLGFLVSRDTANLSETEVRESAVESLAENLNDSVVAPIFWFVLFGLPGAAVYRFANTADAMWGYRGLRHGVNWEWAGKWAARVDDVLSWMPARITALLLKLLSQGVDFNSLGHEARKTPSPNSGWPMAAMALALGVRLQKPGVYVLNPSGRPPEPKDAVLAQKKASKVVVAACLFAQAAMLLIAYLKS